MEQNHQVRDFFTQYPQHTYKPGEILLSPGDEPQGIFFLAEGQVRQYDIAQNGSEVVVNIFRPGAHFPMTWAIHAEPNDWYFDAVTGVTAHLCPASESIDFLKSNPEAMYSYLERLCSGASGQQRRMAHLMGGTARTRTIFELITEARRFGETKDQSVVLNSSDNELASKAGLSREALNRELSRLRDEGLIAHEYKTITIASISDLEKALGSIV